MQGNLEEAPTPLATDAETIREALKTVKARIESACEKVGRASSEVRLLPVSKTVPVARLQSICGTGCLMLGENKVQEGFSKWKEMTGVPGLQWALIGHLQTNKVKQAVMFASEFHALDSLRVAKALDKQLQVQGRSLDVYIQVNTSGETSKYGLFPSDVQAFLRELPSFSSLRVRGLMTLAIFSPDMEKVRRCFALLRSLRDGLRQSCPQNMSLDELSMGMSGDFETAIEEGATIVRVGQAIFGARSGKDVYWPGGGAQSPR